MLISVMVFRGCSASVETSRGSNQQLDGSSRTTPKPADAPADPADTPPPTEKIPTEVKTDWDKKIADLRDEIAESDCKDSTSPQGARIKKVLDLLVCRVKEQNDWFENPLLYKSPDNNHSCVTQTKQLHTNVLKNAKKETTADGSSWLADACKAATDQALENLNTGKRFESSNGKDIPTKAEIKRALNLVLTKIKESKYADFDVDPEAEEETHNIKLMLEYSLNRINHNCAAHMDTDGFLPRKIRSDESQGNAKVSYIFREYYNYPDGGANKIDPVFGRYFHVIHDKVENIRVYGKSLSSEPFRYLPKSAYDGDDETPAASDLVTIATIDNMFKLRTYLNRISLDKCAADSLDDCKTDADSDATVAKADTIVSDDFGNALSYKEKRDIIPIRKIETQCTACDAYKRHQKSTTGETNKADAAQTTFFNHTDFDIGVKTNEISCKGGYDYQKMVVPAGEMCEEDDAEEEEIEPLASKFPSCKYYRRADQDADRSSLATNHIGRGIICYTREAPSSQTLTSFCDNLPNNEREGKTGVAETHKDEPFVRKSYCEKGSALYNIYHGTCPTVILVGNGGHTRTSPTLAGPSTSRFGSYFQSAPPATSDAYSWLPGHGEGIRKETNDIDHDHLEDCDLDSKGRLACAKGFCLKYSVRKISGTWTKQHPLPGHPEIKTDGRSSAVEAIAMNDHHADESAICHLKGSTLKELEADEKAKSACTMRIRYNEAANSREDAQKNLARFIGVKYADLGKCQFEVDTDLHARDYRQFNLCATPYTFYADGGDGERAPTSQNPDSTSSFNTAREKFCITR